MAAKPDYTKYAGWTRGEMIRTIEALISRQTELLNAISRLENSAREVTVAGSVTGKWLGEVPPDYDAFDADRHAMRYPWETNDDK